MHEQKRGSPIPGLILVALGIFFFLANFGVFRLRGELIWTYVLIFLGIAFWIGYFFDRSQVGRLMPGCVLLTLGILFHYTTTHGWDTMSVLWPFVLLAPAFGFYAMFIFGPHDGGLLVPAGILTILAAVFLFQNYDRDIRFIWPAVLIAIGVLLLYRGRPRGDTRDERESGCGS
jgi:hypothetical protein